MDFRLMLRFVLTLFLLVFSFDVFSQGKSKNEPFQIDLNSNEQPLPIVYYGVNNMLRFEPVEWVDSVKVVSDSIFSIVEGDSGVFTINSPMHFDRLPEPGKSFDLNLFLHNGGHRNFKFNTAYLPPVEIEFFLDGVKINDGFVADSVYECELYFTHARLVYPKYVTGYSRLRGVHEVDIYLNEDRIGGTTGWYDSGDRSQMHGLPIADKILELRVREDKLISLKFGCEFRSGPQKLIQLSDSTPRIILVRAKKR
jgi:hypothetical protein